MNIRSVSFNIFSASARMKNPYILFFLLLGVLFPAEVFAHGEPEGENGDLSFSIRFVRHFPFQRVRLSSDGLNQWLFLTLFHDNQVVRLDLKTGKTLETIQHVPLPESIIYNPVGQSVLVALGDSRAYMVSPVGKDGPPLLDQAGLNPIWVGGAPALGYYLLAGAVHILYSLDPENYHATDWIALGDKVHEVTLDPARKKIYFPLYRKRALTTVSIPEFRRIATVDLDSCLHPKIVLPDGGAGLERVLILCRNGLFEGDSISGGFKKIIRFREYPGTMARIGQSNLIAISFPDAHEVRIFDQKQNRIVKVFPSRGRPVFLSSFRDRNDLLLISNRPASRLTQLTLYRVSGGGLQTRTFPSGSRAKKVSLEGRTVSSSKLVNVGSK
ncbi:MAG: YncE family protein [Leptospirales bacterium]